MSNFINTINRNAFTLIEMLVVITIIAILSTMIFITQESTFEEVLAADTLALRATLDRARSLSVSTGNSHGVAFHIENAGDGTVLKNASINDADKESFIGRHWYAIIGPDKEGVGSFNFQSRKGELPPLVKGSHGGTKTFATLQEYAGVFEKAQVGPRQYLSEGVRFLALSDINEVYEYKASGSGVSRLPPHPSAPPRPWFGWYDNSTNTLYPWGAYNRDIDKLLYLPNTGLDYAGFDGEISYDPVQDTNVSPDKVWGRINLIWDFEASTVSSAVYSGATAQYPGLVATKDGESSNNYNRTVNYIGPDTSVLAQKKRPLVNAYWCDFMIYYLPSGAARVTTGHARHFFLNRNSYNTSAEGRAEMGIKFEDDKIGGYSITLCRDIDPEADKDLYPVQDPITGQPAYNKFNSVADAFKTITPFMRVFVDEFNGVSAVRTNDHPLHQITADDLLQSNPYPRGTD